MSSAFKTLTLSDFTVIPYKALKNLEFTGCSIFDAGFRVYKGVNIPQTITGSLPQEGIYYNSIKNLYYSNALSASLGSGSGYYDYNQSTAASGTFQSDVRYFPTESGATIKVLSIPQGVYGEAISPKTFRLASDSNAYCIVDDGNGNLIDLVDCGLSTSLTNSEIYNSDLLYGCIRSGSVVGNIIYPQGILIVTSQDYDCLFDAGPSTSDIYEVFLSSDVPKIISPLVTTVQDCTGLDSTTLQLTPVAGSTFPSYVMVGGQIELSESDPLTNTEGTYYIDYGVKSLSCAPSNVSRITVSIINCEIIGGTVTIQPTPTPSITPSITPTKTLTPTPTPTVTPSHTPSPTVTPTYTPSPTVTPQSECLNYLLQANSYGANWFADDCSGNPVSGDVTFEPGYTGCIRSNTLFITNATIVSYQTCIPGVSPTPTPTSTATPTVTPTATTTPTPTVSTPLNSLGLNICVTKYGVGTDYYQNYVIEISTTGDIYSNPPSTDVTLYFNLSFVNTFGQYATLYGQSITLPASTVSYSEIRTVNQGVSTFANVLATAITPTTNGGQTYKLGTISLNDPGCAGYVL